MTQKTYQNPVAEGADPFILLHNGKYYHYATSAPDGFRVLESDDLVSWTDRGYCLHKDNVYGEHSFWAPEIKEKNGRFYIVYSSENYLAVATADSPLGPFKQEKKCRLSDRIGIDGDYFIDDDGQVYLYYVRFDGGNVIYGTKMSGDMLTMDEENEVRLLTAEEEWETLHSRITEGPFMLKHNGKYYLTYSANDFRSPFYAIGYAVSDSPLGPFKKYEGNPILRKSEHVNGTGHHSFTSSKDGSRLICVYHCHRSLTEIHPRMTCIDPAEFVPSPLGGDDVLKIHGPTTTVQEKIW